MNSFFGGGESFFLYSFFYFIDLLLSELSLYLFLPNSDMSH